MKAKCAICATCEHKSDSGTEYCGTCGNGIESNWSEAGWIKDKKIKMYESRIAELSDVEEIKGIMNSLKIELAEGKCSTCEGNKFYTVKNEDGTDRKVDCMFCADLDSLEPTGKQPFPIITNFNEVAQVIYNRINRTGGGK